MSETHAPLYALGDVVTLQIDGETATGSVAAWLWDGITSTHNYGIQPPQREGEEGEFIVLPESDIHERGGAGNAPPSVEIYNVATGDVKGAAVDLSVARWMCDAINLHGSPYYFYRLPQSKEMET